jgi:hypothetical protein
VGERETMSAAYSGCASIGSGCGNEQSRGVDGASITGKGLSCVVSTRLARDENASTVSSGADGAQGTSRYGASGAGESREGPEPVANRELEAGVVREAEGHEAKRLGHTRMRLMVSVTIGDGRQW